MSYPRTETTSPPIVGRLASDSGTPIANASVAVSIEWDDRACRKAVRRVITDTAGKFDIRASEKHLTTMWIIPNFHAVPPPFALCVALSDTMRFAYEGRGSLGSPMPPDTLDCIAWKWETRDRVTCAGRADSSLVTGGRWADAAGEGIYRVFIVEEPTRVKGYDKGHREDRPYVYVQWLETHSLARETAMVAAHVPHRVRATVSLPINRNRFTHLHRAELVVLDNRWVLELRGTETMLGQPYTPSQLRFALGAPAQAAAIEPK